ncbi:MAG: ATP-binding protein, partial [Flavobacteriaceae bacterium]
MFKKTISFLSLFILGGIVYGQNEANFIQLNKPFTNVQTIEQDSLGFMWFTSGMGLYKFDGKDYFFKPTGDIFKDGESNFIIGSLFDKLGNYWYSSNQGSLVKISRDNDTLNLGKKNIYRFVQHKTDVWMGSGQGTIYKYDTKAERLDSISAMPKINGFTQYTKELAFSKDNLWIVSFEGNAYKYSTKETKLTEVNNLNQLFVTSVTSDKQGRVWLATEFDGLFIYDESTEKLEKYNNTELLKPNGENPFFIVLFCDKQGHIWAGTDGDGLYKINLSTNKTAHYTHDPSNKFSVNNNTVIRLLGDADGNLWVVGKRREISILPFTNNTINYYSGSQGNTPTPVLSILKTSDGSLWLGTDGEGLNRTFPDGKKVQYNNSQNGKYFFKGGFINRMTEDNGGNVWISTYRNGLWVFNLKNETFTKVIFSPKQEDKFTINTGLLFKDSKGRIWTSLASDVNEPKIYVFSNDLKTLASFSYNANGLSGKELNSITEDESGTLWLAISKGGLFQLNENTLNLSQSAFTKYAYTFEGPDDYYSQEVSSLLPDNNGNLLMTTITGKFVKFSLADHTFHVFKGHYSSNEFYSSSMLIENKNSIWFGGHNGIKHYNISTNTLTTYTQNDGFLNRSYRLNCAFEDTSGKMYFGGEFGVNGFYPSQLQKKEIHAHLYISDIEILNAPAATVIPEQFNTRTELVKDLKLKAGQSSFSFSFSAISNNLIPNYHYAYRLKGFNTDWITPKQEGVAAYTNIPHGHYTFEVKAGTKNNIWDIEPIAIDLVISPPWWLTNAAYIGYALLFSLLIYGIYLWLRLKNRLHNEALKFNNEKELYALKMNFFAKMSHEIQTPLTLILGPISDMLERATANGNDLLRQRLIMIKNNASRLSRIALELMTLRNKELNKLKLYASKNNIIADLDKIAGSFSEQAKFKNITFTQDFPTENLVIWYDQEKIEHVFYNLLSNALKFTPVNGKVSLKVTQHPDDEAVEITVSDSGPGIPETELNNIFEFLYQADLGKNTKGSGIGLALTKELVQLHHGSITVNSILENGTRFSVKLPTNESIFTQDEKAIILNSKAISAENNGTEDQYEENPAAQLKAKTKSHTLLIVEDNIDMQIFLKDILNENYKLIIANNGQEGLEMAEQHSPDLIISDIMMPVMDGMEMTKTLKNNKLTAHIPVILLTAKNTAKGKISGLKTGAVEYLRKPFNVHELLLKTNNIIASQERTLNKYKTDRHSIPTENNDVKSKDDIFLENLTKELNDQLFNTDFRLEDLPKTINMSYSGIYRKCHDLTGKTPVELLRKLKLSKAAVLILKNNYNVSEAAFMVGYKDSKYFTKSFKDEFGKTPS